MTRTTRMMTLMLATLSILLASCGSDESPDVASLASEGPSETETISDVVATDVPDLDRGDVGITVSNQTSDGTSVVIDEVIALDTRAFVVIHRDEQGAPGEVIGHAPVPFEGPTTGITVDLDTPLDAGTHTVWAMVHVDNEPIGVYQFPGNDTPATAEGTVIMDPIEVTVE